MVLLVAFFAISFAISWFIIKQKVVKKYQKAIFLKLNSNQLQLLVYGFLALIHSLLLLNFSNMLFTNNPYNTFITFYLWITFILIFFGIYYLAIFDFIEMEIPLKVTAFLSVLILFFNISLAVLFKGEDIFLIKGVVFNPIVNIITGTFLAMVFGAVVFFSKEKLLGSGDIFLVFIMGLMLGPSKSFFAIYLTIFLGAIIGLIVAFKNRRLKGLKIPLVPFLAFSIIITINFWSLILPFLLNVVGLKFLR